MGYCHGRPTARSLWGFELDHHRVVKFQEKPHGDGGWINGDFSFSIRKYSTSRRSTTWEREPLQTLAAKAQLTAYYHFGFGNSRHLRDKIQLEDLWSTGQAPWKTW